MFNPGGKRELSDRARRLRPVSPAFYAHLPYALEVDDVTVRSRENALMTSFEVRGLDGMTASDQEIADLASGFAAILDGLDERFTFYVHRLTRKASFGLKRIYGDSFEADLEARWRAHLEANDLHDFMIVATVVRNLRAPLRVPIFARQAKRLLDRDTTERLGELKEAVSVLAAALPVKTQTLRISDGSLLGFYVAINTGIVRKEYRGHHTLVAEDVANTAIRFRGSVAELTEGVDRPRVAAVLSVKKYPTQTWNGMFDGLDSATDLVICHSYTPLPLSRVADMARQRIQQMRAAGDAAVSIEDDLARTYDDVEAGRVGFGEHQFTITVFAPDVAQLEERVARIRGIAEQAKMTLVRTSETMAATYFAMHPGNQDYQMWAPIVKSINFADMASLHMAEIGTPSEHLPWRTPITVFQTVTGAPHRFSFHEAGAPEAEPTIGHTLVLGPSGSGKTATVAFLVAQARRVGVRTILFDKDQGLRMAIAAMSGRYAEVKAGELTGLNPLATESGPRGEAWLLHWLTRLVESNGSPLSPQQADTLKSAVRQNSTAPDALKSFRHFQDLIGDVGDDRALAMRVSEWGPEGRYNWVFGEAGKPIVDLTSVDVTGIDLTEILNMPAERTAVLSYLFRRLEILFEEKRPTLLVIDEASTVFDDDFFALWLPKWLVTLRKLNVVVVLLTQFPSQIRQSRSGSILEALPNQLIFPNRKADLPDYDGFGLTDNELHFLLTGRAGQRQALLRSHGSSTLLDVDLSALGPLLTALGGGEAGSRAFGADYEERSKFWRTQGA
jgi:type IV secretion system protein VirB4